MIVFARQFSRRVKSHVGTDVLFARRVIERVAWIFDDGCVPAGICVRAQAEKHLACVVHVAIFIHGDDVFAEHHLAHAPETMHHFKRLIRVLFANADKDQIVKNSFGRQRHIHEFGEIHFEHRQQESARKRRRCSNPP